MYKSLYINIYICVCDCVYVCVCAHTRICLHNHITCICAYVNVNIYLQITILHIYGHSLNNTNFTCIYCIREHCSIIHGLILHILVWTKPCFLSYDVCQPMYQCQCIKIHFRRHISDRSHAFHSEHSLSIRLPLWFHNIFFSTQKLLCMFTRNCQGQLFFFHCFNL